jgi:DNA-binding XRE family transcriptional regulator
MNNPDKSIKAYKTLMEYSTETHKWGFRSFQTYKDYYDFVLSNWKLPGEYNFKNTEYWRQPAITFEKNKMYCDFHRKSPEYKEYWLTERRKCVQGVIVDNVFIPASYYWFINFTPIYDKVKSKETFADLYDGQYHLFLYLELAMLKGEDAAGVKCRQRGISYCLVSDLTKEIWFGQKSMCKIVGYEIEYVMLEWNILESYRDFLNTHTGWYRAFSPDESLNWEQKMPVTEGVTEKKTTFKGNKSRIKGATTKKNMAKAVGGPAKKIYATEAGVYANLLKVKGYVNDNLKLGGVKTGIFLAFGSVGELKDAADLQDICFNPRAYNVRPVKDTFSGSGDEIAFLYPDEWNFTYRDPETEEVVKCYDKDGNSNIELALKYISMEEEHAKKSGESAYKMYKSQHPRTLQDAFDQREDNPFPTSLLKKREQDLINYKDIIVKLERNDQGKVIHKFSDDVPILTLHPKPDADNRGAVTIWEFPKPNPPLGLYYAGVDPVKNFDTSTSSSLMSITVYMADHERDGKICQGYPVATYTGRHKRVSETYQVCLNLIEFYNALTAVESNVADFTEWMIKERKAKYLMRRSQITVINEMMPNSTIRDEIGVRMEGHFKQRCIEKLIRYLEEPMSDVFDLETGENYTKHGVDKIRDKMFIRELLRWTSKLNTDRLVSNILAIMAAESSTNRHILQEIKKGDHRPNTKTSHSLPSAFLSKSRPGMSKMPSPFKRK